MESVFCWILNKIHFIKRSVVGLAEDEPRLPPLWSLESPFKQWTIYSKALLASSLICFFMVLILQVCKRPAVTSQAMVRRIPAAPLGGVGIHPHHLLDSWRHYLLLLVVLSSFVSIPWEWFRLYKIEVAKKRRILSEVSYRKSFTM